MKRSGILFFVLCMLSVGCLAVSYSGMPFIRNFLASEYHAHNRNFDIENGKDGMLFVANFEGLLYYDQASWNIVRTDKMARLTTLATDSQGKVWAGGYNYIGSVEVAPNGSIFLQPIAKSDSLQWEVRHIWEENGHVMFLTSSHHVYAVDSGRMTVLRENADMPAAASSFLNDPGVTDVLNIDNGLQVVGTNSKGLFLFDRNGTMLCNITEANGLCSNNVVSLAYNDHGVVWGATYNGIFAVSLPSAYTRFQASEGLRGEVLSMGSLGSQMFVGTLSGLYRQDGNSFVEVEGVNRACWSLQPMNGRLLAATEGGVYAVSANGTVEMMNEDAAMSLWVENNHYYSGESDGIYINLLSPRSRQLVSEKDKVQRVVQVARDSYGTLWARTLYGKVWNRQKNAAKFSDYTADINKGELATIVYINGKVMVVDAQDTKPFDYPQFSYTDNAGLTWLTDNQGKNLYVWKNGKRQEEYAEMLYPIRNEVVQSVFVKGEQVWLGGEFGVIVIDRSIARTVSETKPKLRFRSITVNGDSTALWGGVGTCPDRFELGSKENNLYFTFALDYTPLQGEVRYRYRLEGGSWNEWSTKNSAEYANQPSGTHKFQVQAEDPMGNKSEIISVEFTIELPFYLKWYMMLLYVLLLALFVYAVVRLRLQRLERAKQQLEDLVNERTAELNQAQHELIRQEKMATVGKLTEGLIDRILNPLNYINNFSKLSEGLVKDVVANIEEEKDSMTPDNYDDTIDVLNMLEGNLRKVGEHGQNTTRTLKAMEEMLKDRSGGMAEMDLAALLRQNKEMLLKYYDGEIAKYHIQVAFHVPDGPFLIKGNAEQLSKTVMSLISNAVYAVVRKAEKQQAYTPEISLSLERGDASAIIKIRDNGTGINDKILNKIFDPFFTTKPTAEASGVGLYLSREIAQNHGGDIVVESVANEYTLFTITLSTP